MDSLEYWSKREAENLRKNKKSEAVYERRIRNIYQRMIDNIEKEINGFYTKYAKAEGITMAEAKKRVSKLDIEEYSRKAAQYVKEKNFTEKANQEMRLYNATMKINRLELLKAQMGLEMCAAFSELENYYTDKMSQRAMDEFRRQAGILAKGVDFTDKTIESIVDSSFYNASFSDRIWMYQAQLKSELESLLSEGIIQGRNPRVLAKHLEKRFGASRENAERLMRTELARVQTETQMKSYVENDFEDYEFIAENDACPICLALNGKRFKVKKMQYGKNAPPIHPHCRCSTAPYMDREEFERWLETI